MPTMLVYIFPDTITPENIRTSAKLEWMFMADRIVLFKHVTEHDAMQFIDEARDLIHN